MFVAQLERVPATVLTEESRALLRLVPGPAGWVTPGVLQSLVDLGMGCEFSSLASRATAAAARTCHYEDRVNGGLRARDRAERLLGRLSSAGADGVSLGVIAWVGSCSLRRLVEAADAVTAAERSRGVAVSLLEADPLDEDARKTWQRRAVAVLRPRVSAALPHA
eukprot:166060-Pyramimonas_sp.AAC.1